MNLFCKLISHKYKFHDDYNLITCKRCKNSWWAEEPDEGFLEKIFKKIKFRYIKLIFKIKNSFSYLFDRLNKNDDVPF